MEWMSFLALALAIVALAGLWVLGRNTREQTESLRREVDHQDLALAAGERVPGTDWLYCDGDCTVVPRQNNRMKCRPVGCAGGGCSCQIFRRPKPLPDDWDGKYEHVGAGSTEHEKESGWHYLCWCVEPAGD